MPQSATVADLEQIKETLDTGQIRDWRSIVTLIVFVLTNITVLFPFHVPLYIPRSLVKPSLHSLSALRMIARSPNQSQGASGEYDGRGAKTTTFLKFRFPLNFLTAPLIADLFLLAILAIGRTEVHDGTVGANHISPLDIMGFFLSLAYIAISIDASGLIRFLAFKVLQKGGNVGHRLFLYLYLFFFGLTAFIGNDPIILSGTPFLAYMTRVSSNIVHPRAWIYTQFAVANIASAILVSSNPTNLVLAGAFRIKFINYTANIIVPVMATAIILCPVLLYLVFANQELIPRSIKMHELPEELLTKRPVNPNIPYARGAAEDSDQDGSLDDATNVASLEEILNPFIDRTSAIVGSAIMAATLITLLALNAAQGGHTNPVFWVTLPAAFLMFCWDIGFGWYNREETRKIAQKGKEDLQRARAERAVREEMGERRRGRNEKVEYELTPIQPPILKLDDNSPVSQGDNMEKALESSDEKEKPSTSNSCLNIPNEDAKKDLKLLNDYEQRISRHIALQNKRGPATLVSKCSDAFKWAQKTFPTATTVLSHLPFALVPFAFCMFILVQALVTKGWVPVFAHGWDHWVNRTGTVGAVGGMGFLSVVLSNFAGTNIGTAILLSRVIQAWQDIHTLNSTPISNRTFWATVYAAALGLNYGAFSAAFSASLAGLLWRDILARKGIRIRGLDFARLNLPIIAVTMAVGCAVLVGQVFVVRGGEAYDG
ncbi:hypothetical protein P154DRAFT_523616 [Amniculicola lignicola CBS 123094]|uniref:Citrate transporter-like domain-containing protein n=1 Tax=Amniculicola lignicola CBS 123094 TaxID=1392246 RepID=A0A6A5WIN2_9PLEO|nr:hypothetical protein P154DRAFT_523616 [Amniculicola lignicola CBS 123094]